MASININHNLAQNIVEAIHEVCDCPINFIDINGIIIASTDQSRINEFHEAGFAAIQDSSLVVVESDDNYKGTKKGVNYPIYINEKPIAVVGITGNPEQVSKFGFLATKVTEIFIREEQMNKQNESMKQRMNYFIRSYVNNEHKDKEYLMRLQESFGIRNEQEFAVMVIKLNKRYNLQNLNMIDKKVNHLFEELFVEHHTYIYPNEFIGFIKKERYPESKKHMDKLYQSMHQLIEIGIGTVEPLERLYSSYDRAKMALKYAIRQGSGYQYFENLTIEMIIGSIPDTIKLQYVKKILKEIDDNEKEILQFYFNNNMSLKETAREFYIHINTLQYKLDKIYIKTGMNPRLFKDATILYLAILLEDL